MHTCILIAFKCYDANNWNRLSVEKGPAIKCDRTIVKVYSSAVNVYNYVVKFTFLL